jgi:hypothetical protein
MIFLQIAGSSLWFTRIKLVYYFTRILNKNYQHTVKGSKIQFYDFDSYGRISVNGKLPKQTP